MSVDFMETFVIFVMFAWMYMDIQCNLANWTTACPRVIMQEVDLNVVPTVEESAPQSETRAVERMTSRDYQISLIEARGPNSRGVQMLRAAGLSRDGVADKAKSQPPEPVQASVSLPVNAMPHIRNSEGQYYRVYPKYGWQV
jgi:hypothetical protein